MSERPPDATDLREAIVAGRRTCLDVVEESLARIAARDGELGAFLVVLADRAREKARALDEALASGEPPGPLCGVPVALKANMCLEGVETSCASRMLAGWKAPYTATFVRRLERAGAIPVGVTNMDEFAMGSSGENSACGVTRNPWDPARTPGGSSSGAAAAVAAGMVPLALGSDTGGSVRQPAAFCGILGLKPTYGRVSRFGLVAFASSLDQVSPCARSARDLALCLAAISGHDPKDSTSLELPPWAPEGAGAPERLEGLRVGVPAELVEGCDEGVRAAFEAALVRLVELGAERVEIELPHARYAIPTYYVVATAEASGNLARYDGVTFGLRVEGDGTLAGMMAATRSAGFGPEVRRRILLGTHVLSSGYHDEWYGRALRARRRILEDHERAFESCEVIATPTAPTVAFRLGEKTADPLAMYLSDALTVPASLAGLPALSVPAGLAAAADDPGARLPVGLQLVGPARTEGRLLSAAAALERVSEPLAVPGGAA